MTASETKVSDHRGYHYRPRNAEQDAREDLRRRGYTVLRSCETDAPVHLVAWKMTRGTLFIRVATTRRAITGAADVTALWREDVDRLRFVSVPDGSEVHLWVSTDRKGWHRYRVLPGGITEVEV